MTTCRDLAARIEQLQPDALPRDVARLCLLLSNAVDDLDDLAGDDALCAAWRSAGLRMQSLTDQHAAMTNELESLAHDEPRDLEPEDTWTLLRAIKVQSRILDLYLGQTTPAA